MLDNEMYSNHTKDYHQAVIGMLLKNGAKILFFMRPWELVAALQMS